MNILFHFNFYYALVIINIFIMLYFSLIYFQGYEVVSLVRENDVVLLVMQRQFVLVKLPY